MRVLDDEVDKNDPSYIENYREMIRMNNLVEDYVEDALKINRVKTKKLEADGRMDPRCRIHKLLDRGTPFLEIGQLAGCEDGIPSGNVIAGIGQVNNR